jgi:branched-chain amino acid transport system substrate-binding protein
MAPTTGDYASAGEEIQRGITIAQDQLRLEGIQTKISFENACLPAQGVTALRKMLDKDKIEAIVSNYCVITLNAILPIIAKNSVITFQNSSVPEKLITSSPFTYSTWPSIEQEVGAMIAAAGDESIKRPGLIYLESPWGSGYADAFREALSNRGIKPLVDLSQGFDVHDFRSETTRLASTKSSMILAAHTGAVMASFLKQARVMNIQGSSIFVPSDNDDQAIVSSAGVAAEGVSLFSTESPKESPARSRYRSEYEKRYKRSPDPLSRHAYDQLILTARALSECKRDISCARTRIEATSNYDGASGQFSMTSKRTPLRPLYRKQVRDGAFRFVE